MNIPKSDQMLMRRGNQVLGFLSGLMLVAILFLMMVPA